MSQLLWLQWYEDHLYKNLDEQTLVYQMARLSRFYKN